MTITKTEVLTVTQIQETEQDGWAVRQLVPFADNYNFVVVFEAEVPDQKWHKQDRRRYSGAAFVSSKGADAS